MSRLPRDDERIARVLDGEEPTRDVRAAALVAVAGRVRNLGREPLLDPEPDFRAGLRERLLAEALTTLPQPRTPEGPDSPHPVLARAHRHAGTASTASTAGTAARPGARGAGGRHAAPAGAGRSAVPSRSGRARGRTRPRALLVGALVAFALSGTATVASNGSLPGEPLYTVRLAKESVATAFTRGDAAKGRRHLAQARSRAQRIGVLATRPGNADLLVGALADMDRLTRAGFRALATAAVTHADTAALTDLTTWVSDQQTLVGRTWPDLPGPAQRQGSDSLALLRDASFRVTALAELPACACPAPPTDDLGPLPERCPTCPEPAKGLAAQTRSGTGPTSTAPRPGSGAGRDPAAAPPTPARTAGGRTSAGPGPGSGAGSVTSGPAPSGRPGTSSLPPASGPLPSSVPAPEMPVPTPAPPPIIDVPSLLDAVIGLLPPLLGG
ncbi:MAG TPA: DUF5667 domain-containing protein [Mycobacteriales bacterium]